MALSDPEHPRGLAALKYLLTDDERGSAAVEFIVLIPVYITILTAVFAMSEMMMAHQALVMASRYDAWSGARTDPGTIDGAFFGPYTGAYGRGEVTPQAVTFDATQLQQGGATGTAAQQQVAIAVLNNAIGEGEALREYTVEATYEYTGLLVGGGSLGMSTSETLYLRVPHTRPEHEDGAQEHWIADEDLPARGRFDPADDQHRYLSPQFRHFSGDGAQEELWDLEARIGGNFRAERRFYQRQSELGTGE